jgi:hypothetical protein
MTAPAKLPTFAYTFHGASVSQRDASASLLKWSLVNDDRHYLMFSAVLPIWLGPYLNYEPGTVA